MAPNPPSDPDATVLGAAADAVASPLESDTLNALPAGTRLHEFEILGVIGEGGFGIVYLAQDHVLGRRVALKEYLPASMALRPAASTAVRLRATRHADTFALGLRSFVNEARLLAQFDHPALLKVYRFWEDHGTAYMVMPYYEGRTLRAAFGAPGAPRPDEAWIRRLLKPLMDALETMHAARCYHRDVAPDNILLQAGDQPVLLDFGAARRVLGDATQDLTVILKAGYAPIEQYAQTPGVEQGPWTDVYALAAVLHFLLLGQPPPPAVARVVHDSALPLSEAAAGRASPAFLRGVDRCLALWPADRPASMDAMREVLGLGRNAASAAAGSARGAGRGSGRGAGLDTEGERPPRLTAGPDAIPSSFDEPVDAEPPRGAKPPRAAPPDLLDAPPRTDPAEATPSQARLALRGGALALGVVALGVVATWAWRAPNADHAASAPVAAAASDAIGSSPLGASLYASAPATAHTSLDTSPDTSAQSSAQSSAKTVLPEPAADGASAGALPSTASGHTSDGLTAAPASGGPATPEGPRASVDATGVEPATPPAPSARKRRVADPARSTPTPARASATSRPPVDAAPGEREAAGPVASPHVARPSASSGEATAPADLEADRRKVRELNDKLDELLKTR